MRHQLKQLIAVAALLTASTLFAACLASDEGSDVSSSECEPEIPPNADPNGTMVALQMHQWIWIENLTEPDWAPRTENGGMFYEFLRPGVVIRRRIPLLGSKDMLMTSMPASTTVYVNISYVTNGDTLCAAALTENRNRTSGDLDSTSCSRICHSNFTTIGTQANLPLLVLDDWTKMSRSSEYLAFDAVDPDSRASYKCVGQFNYQRMSTLPRLLTMETQCPQGDECLFNYDTVLGFVGAGCKSNFRMFSWCVSDVEICSYNIDGDCPVCCRGDLCNREVAQKAYQKWLDNRTSRSVASVGMLLVSVAFSLALLRSQY